MKNNTAIPSLCSYLDPDRSGFGLAFSPADPGDPGEGGTPFPFVMVERFAPLSRVIRARVVTDTGAGVAEVFVVLEKDRYSVSGDPLHPLTNPDVESLWQQAFSFLTKPRSAVSPMVLSEQVDPQGRLVRLQSLFYCKHMRRFFAPPCPACGTALEQCEDDQVLLSRGLSPYSDSLKRYLYCPTCFEKTGTSDFYVYALDEEEAGGVKDRWNLIEAFGGLQESREVAEEFPCARCTQAPVCFGDQARARVRIVPVCFYPFYMLIVPAMSLKAQDFLALISGCPVQVLKEKLLKAGEIGRSACVDGFEKQFPQGDGFLFQGTARHFLEILYLKLCFLGGLYEIVGSDRAASHDPAWLPGLDGIWVKLADTGKLLPAFWHFRLATLCVEAFNWKTAGAPVPPARDTLYFMGLAWAFALMVNDRQGAREVSVAVKQALEKASVKDKGDLDGFSENAFGAVCSPENLLWDPEAAVETDLGETDYTLWKRAMQLGWSLLIAGTRADTAFSHEVFQKDLEALTSAVRRELFAQRAGVEQGIGATPASSTAVDDARALEQDRAIVEILERIAGRWRAELAAEAEPHRAGETPIPADQVSGEQTVMLAPGALGTRPGISDDDEDARETVILSAADLATGPETDAGVTEPESPRESPLEETVLVSRPEALKTVSGAAPPETTAAPATQPSEEDMPETVIVSPAQLGGEPVASSGRERVTQPPPPDNDMPETVMISPSDVAKATRSAQDPSSGTGPDIPKRSVPGPAPGDPHPELKGPPAEKESDDELAETVILSPGASKEKGE